MAKIGIFWLYQNTVIGKAIDKNIGKENYPGIVDSPDSHIDYWENDPGFVKPFPELVRIDYHTIPRGRVLYHRKHDIHIVYMDQLLFNTKAKDKIKAYFEISNENVSWKTDQHYTTKPDLIEQYFNDIYE